MDFNLNQPNIHKALLLFIIFNLNSNLKFFSRCSSYCTATPTMCWTASRLNSLFTTAPTIVQTGVPAPPTPVCARGTGGETTAAWSSAPSPARGMGSAEGGAATATKGEFCY